MECNEDIFKCLAFCFREYLLHICPKAMRRPRKDS